MKVKASSNRVRLQPGLYIAETLATVWLSQHVGDDFRDVTWRKYRRGERFEVLPTINKFWYGLAPNIRGESIVTLIKRARP